MWLSEAIKWDAVFKILENPNKSLFPFKLKTIPLSGDKSHELNFDLKGEKMTAALVLRSKLSTGLLKISI